MPLSIVTLEFNNHELKGIVNALLSDIVVSRVIAGDMEPLGIILLTGTSETMFNSK